MATSVMANSTSLRQPRAARGEGVTASRPVAERCSAVSRALPVAGVAFAGLLFTVACPPYEYSLAAWAVPGLLLVATRRLRAFPAFLCGVLYAVVIGSLITRWAPHAALAYFDFNPLLARVFILGVHVANPGIPCGLLLVAYAAAARRLPASNRAAVGAVLWVACEWLRTWSLGWELLAHSQFQHLYLIQIADLGGAYALSFVMAFASIAVAELLAEWRIQRPTAFDALGRLALPATAVAVTLAYGVATWNFYGTNRGGLAAANDEDLRTVAIVQGNVPNQFRWNRAFFGRTLATYAALTSTQGARPDLVVWPENAVSFYVNKEDLLRSQLAQVAATAGDNFLVGAPRRGDGALAYNSAYLFSADGTVRGIYDKQRLLPFAEYNPLVTPAQAADSDDIMYAPGSSAAPLDAQRMRLGTMICFEVLYPHLVRDLVRHGAEVLVNLSNDSWMDSGDGAAPRQHFSMAVFRAVETRRYLVRAASSGVSGFISPAGERHSMLAAGTTGTVLAPVYARHGETPYVRWGDTWILLALALVLVQTTPRLRPKLAASTGPSPESCSSQGSC